MTPQLERQLSPASPEAGAEARQQASYDFILCRHHPYNVPEIVDKLGDSDVVALELSGICDRTTQEAMAEYATRMISTEDPMGPGDTDENLVGNRFVTELLARLRGSNKTVEFIDITRDHPDYHLQQEAKGAEREYDQALSAQAPHAQLAKLLLNKWRAIAGYAHARDRVMTERLQEIGQEHPGQTVGVVMGAGHTPVYHAVRAHAPAGRVFVDPASALAEGTAEKAHFTYGDQLGREFIFNPDREPDVQLVNRTLLVDIYKKYMLSRPAGDAPEGEHEIYDRDVSYLERQIVGKLSDEQVSGILAAVDAAIPQRMRRLQRGKVAANIRGALQGVEVVGARKETA